MNLQNYFKKQQKRIDRALETLLPKPRVRPSTLHEAMRYAVFGPGKRIRPIFVLAGCEAVGGNTQEALPAACAVELVHSYSLAHDDLPCMDDDDFRRGRPSCHKRFGEETAVLAGDALLTLAFRALSASNGHEKASFLKKRLLATRMIADAIGSAGMVGGQAVDMEYKGKRTDLSTIEYINARKSGALIAASVRVGAFLGGGSPREVEALYRYGKAVGLLFQIVDDILDREGYANVIGLPETQKEASELLRRAKRSLKTLGPRGHVLSQIADFVAERKN